MELLTIRKLAQRAGVNVETVRYYERRGLLVKPLRSPSGYRLFHTTVIRRVQFIKRVQALGFSLQEIDELLNLKTEQRADCGEVWDRLETKISAIEEKIRLLEAMKMKLIQLSDTCPGDGPVSECPILESLETENERSQQEV